MCIISQSAGEIAGRRRLRSVGQGEAGRVKKKRNRTRTAYNYLGMAGITLVVLILLGGFTIKSKDVASRVTFYDAKAASLEQSIEDEKVRTEDIDRLKEHMQTDEYAEEAARERLGLVKDNEIVFKEEE